VTGRTLYIKEEMTMNGMTIPSLTAGFPAIAVLRLSVDRPVTTQRRSNAAGEETLLAAVQHPPRVGETRPIAALLPTVLARYGLANREATGEQATSLAANFSVTELSA
jgi:hypothetical protein